MKKLQILGTGCTRCNLLSERVEEAATELGLEYQMEKITDIADITSFGVMLTPALAADGRDQAPGHREDEVVRQSSRSFNGVDMLS